MEVEVGKIYRHFKGKFYRVEGVAISCETDEKVVIYRALYGQNLLFTRNYDDFIAVLDEKKYPFAKQKHRFEVSSKLEMIREKIIKDREEGLEQGL